MRNLVLCSVKIDRGDFTAMNKLSYLKKNHVEDCMIDDEGMTLFADFLVHNVMLSDLHISGSNFFITEVGLVAIFAALQRSKCRLRWLYLGECNIETDAAAFSLSSALLIQNKTLNYLSLEFSYNAMSTAKWNAVLHLLRSPKSAVEDLELRYINDEGVAALTNAPANNGKLKKICLSGYGAITAAGWVSFATLNPNSVLERLDLIGNYFINDRTIVTFADALAGNNILRELILDSVFALAQLSIVTVCPSERKSKWKSRHCKLMEILKEIRLMSSYNYCNSNRENRVTQAARLKIIQVHFSGREINMQPFTEMKMELSIRPHAIAWMGRDNSLYQFLRAMPSLLGNGDGKKYILYSSRFKL